MELQAIELPDKDNIPEEKLLAALNFKFRTHFQSSPYHLMETYSGTKQFGCIFLKESLCFLWSIQAVKCQ